MDQEVLRKNLMILGQTGIVIVATLIILIIVNFFGILPLSKIAPNLFGWLPERVATIPPTSRGYFDPVKAIELSKVPKKVALSQQPTLELKSDYPGFRVVFNDKNSMVNQISKWGVFGLVYSDENNGNTNGYGISDITIVLVDKKQPIFKAKGKDGEYSSLGYKFDNNKLLINIFISAELLTNDKDSAILIFNQQALKGLKFLAYKVDTLEKYKSEYSEILKLTEQQRNDNNYFISIEKN